MIIWIDGTYGVGKTTVASELMERFSKSMPIVSSYYFICQLYRQYVSNTFNICNYFFLTCFY